jgi:hypothetical protein
LTSAHRTFLTERFLSLGRRREVDPSDPTYSVIGAVVIAPGGQSARFDVCTWNTEILVQALPDAERVVLDDMKTTVRSRWGAQNTESGWLLTDFAELPPKVAGRNECGPRP